MRNVDIWLNYISCQKIGVFQITMHGIIPIQNTKKYIVGNYIPKFLLLAKGSKHIFPTFSIGIINGFATYFSHVFTGRVGTYLINFINCNTL